MPTLSFLLIHSLVFFLVLIVEATPLKRDADSTSDIDNLNFMLWTKHLTSAVLTDGLIKFKADNFENEGYPPHVYGRLQEISQHETTHVDYLGAAISDTGAQPVPSCDYVFSYQDPHSFLATFSMVENVAVSTYDGSIAFFHHKPYSTLTASMLAVDARHCSWLDSAVQKFNPWGTSFETPLTRRHAYSLLSQYVVNCPDNYPINLEPFPPLTFLSTPVPGELVQFDLSQLYAMQGNTQEWLSSNHNFVAFLTGEGILYAAARASEKPHVFEVSVPKTLKGIAYAVLTNSNKNTSDKTTLAGPAFLAFHYNSNGERE